ncbi:MAG: NYN domain-containing protein [Anaerolineae bacterium]
MPFLIDGHNLIGQMPDLSLSDPNDEDKLIARLKQFADRANKRITVVFDPSPTDTTPRIGHGRARIGNLTVLYALPGNKADDVIRNMVGEIKDKQGWIVVTSDAAVANFTRMTGIRVESSTDFIKRLRAALSERPSAEKPQPSSREIDKWADVFKEPAPSADYKPVTPLIKPKPAKKKKKSEVLAEQLRNVRPLV